MLDLIFFPVLFLIGIITSYTDIRYGKIKNKWIILGILYGIICYLFIGLFFKDRFSEILEYPGNLFLDMAANFLLAVLIGVLLWLNNYFSAADAKLFMVFSLLIPVSAYSSFKAFPAINILINAFIVGSIFLIFELAKKSRVRHYLYAIKETFNLRLLAKIISVIFIIEWFSRLFYMLIGVRYSIVISLLFVLTLIPYFMKLFINNNKLIILLIILRAVFDRNIFSLKYVYDFLFITILYIVARLLIKELSAEVFSQNVNIKDLKKGMVLDDYIVRNGKKYALSKFSDGSDLVEQKPEGLDTGDIRKIKAAQVKRKLSFRKVRVLTNIYFAPYLFIGAIIVIVTGTNLVTLIANVLT